MSLFLSLLRRLIQRPVDQGSRTLEPLGADQMKAVAGGGSNGLNSPRGSW